MQPNKRLILRIVGIFLACLVIFGAYNFWRNLSLRLVSTTPSLSSVSDIVPYIDLNFNKKLSSSGVSVSATPNIVLRYSISSTTLRVYLMAMTANKSYLLTIAKLSSVDGKMFSRTLSFKANNTPFNKLSTAEQKQIIDSQDSNNPSLVTSNPLLAHLPYGGLGYNITGVITTVNGKQALIIQVSVVFDGADYSASPQVLQSRVTEREQAAINYIKSLGFNPSNYDIQYSVPTVP